MEAASNTPDSVTATVPETEGFDKLCSIVGYVGSNSRVGRGRSGKSRCGCFSLKGCVSYSRSGCASPNSNIVKIVSHVTSQKSSSSSLTSIGN